MRHLSSAIALSPALVFAASVGCTRQPDRVGESDVPTKPYTQNIQSANSREPASIVIAPIDLEKYPFDKKETFKSDMNARLQSLDRVVTLEKPSPQLRDLQTKSKRLHQELQEVDAVPPQSWDSFKTQFGNQVTSLEKQYNETVAMNR